MRVFALAFVAGAFLLQNQATLPEARWALGALAAALAVVLVRREGHLTRAVLLALCGSLAGFGYAAWRAEVRLAEALPPALENTDIEITGIVAGLPQLTERGTRFAFEVEDPVRKGVVIPSLVSLTWYGDRGMGGAMRPPEVVAGERWRFTARLKRPRGLANPHVYDFEAWALERDLRATGYVRASPAPERLAARVDGWPYTLHRWRGEVRAAMLDHLGDAALRGVLVALAIGDQDAIPAADWDVFWRTGVGHLMSISGHSASPLRTAPGCASAASRFACPHARPPWSRVWRSRSPTR
jgi:competence protein ComEC